jgi:glycosyltransferase involved in cell wall biosynthesis
MTTRADIVHAHSHIFLTSNQVAVAKKLNGLPFLLHLHGGIDCFPPPNNSSLRIKFHLKNKLYDPIIGKWTIQAADAVASVSKKEIIRIKQIWGLDNKAFYWIPNAIDPNKFNLEFTHNHLNVTFIGRLEVWKGIQIFLEAAKLIIKERDDIHFIIVGDGSLRSHVNAVSSTLKGKMTVLGQVPHTAIPKILADSSVLVLPSYVEGVPTVCLEALASKVPVVASNIGGIPEVVQNGKTGYLFSPGEVSLCADRILKLIINERLRKKMGKQGRSLIEKFYTWQRVVDKVEKVYEKILS